MGAFYTAMVVTVTNALLTYTHGLSITAASLIARIIPHQTVLTATAPCMIAVLGTNIVSVASGPGTTQTCDLEVQQVHSIIA